MRGEEQKNVEGSDTIEPSKWLGISVGGFLFLLFFYSFLAFHVYLHLLLEIFLCPPPFVFITFSNLYYR